MFLFCLTPDLLQAKISKRICSLQKPQIGLVARSTLYANAEIINAFPDIASLRKSEQQKALVQKQEQYTENLTNLLTAKEIFWGGFKEKTSPESLESVQKVILLLIEEYKKFFPRNNYIVFFIYILREERKASNKLRNGRVNGRTITQILLDFYDYELKIFSCFCDKLRIFLSQEPSQNELLLSQINNKCFFSSPINESLERDFLTEKCPKIKTLVEIARHLRFYPDLMEIFCGGYQNIKKKTKDFANNLKCVYINTSVKTPNGKMNTGINNHGVFSAPTVFEILKFATGDGKVPFKERLIFSILSNQSIKKWHENDEQLWTVLKETSNEANPEAFENLWELFIHNLDILDKEIQLSAEAFRSFKEKFSFDIKKDYRTRAEKTGPIKQKLAEFLHEAIKELEAERELIAKEKAQKTIQANDRGINHKKEKEEHINKESDEEQPEDKSKSAYPTELKEVKKLSKKHQRRAQRLQENAAATLTSGEIKPQETFDVGIKHLRKIVQQPDNISEKEFTKMLEAINDFIDKPAPTFNDLRSTINILNKGKNTIAWNQKTSSHFNFTINGKVLPEEICGFCIPHGGRTEYSQDEKSRFLIQFNYMLENITGQSIQ